MVNSNQSFKETSESLKKEKRFHSKKSLENYEFVKNQNANIRTSDLGSGAYGKVKLVRDKETNMLFAMKIV